MDNEKRILNLWIDKSDHLQIRIASARMNVSVSEFVRKLAIEAAKKINNEDGQQADKKEKKSKRNKI